MSKDKPLWITGCPLCEAFTNPDESIKLYWPESIEEIKNSEFIIIECQSKKIPRLIYRDHIPNVLSESWGRMLYRSRKIFGNDIKLNISSDFIRDHFNCYVIKNEY